MAAAGFTPIQLYHTATSSAAPTSGNLANGELAINTNDGKLFYKDSGGTVQVIAWKTTPTTAGGTGLTSWTAGDLPYYATGTALSKLGIGTNGQILTSTGTAPQWSTLSGVAVTTFSAGTTGFTPSSATSGAVTLAGTLATTNGGTGLTSFTANGVVYASSSSALTTGSALSFDGANLGVSGNANFGNSGSSTYGGYATGGRIFSLAASGGLIPAISASTDTTTSSTAFRAYTKEIANDTSYAFDIQTGNGTGVTTQKLQLTWGANGLWNSTGLKVIGNVEVTQAQLIGYSSYAGIGTNGLAVAGNLGIGTSSPAYKLDVQGSATDFVAFSGLNTNNNAGLATSSAIKFGFTSTVGTHYATLKITEDAGNDNSGSLTISLPFGGVESTKLTLNSSGNLGLGVTPSAWYTGFKSFQAGATTALADFSSGTYLFNNWYIAASGANTYLTSNFASSYSQVSGEHRFFTAPSGTAGNAISFTQALTLDASGNLLLGRTNRIITETFSSTGYGLFGGATVQGIIGDAGSGLVTVGAYSNHALQFRTNNTERARITSSGTFQFSSNYQEGVVTANTGTTYTISLASGTVQILTLTGNCTFTFPTATAGQSFILLLKQDGTGGRTVTWPAAVKWPSGTAPTITSTASKLDKYIFTADGTNWYGSNAGQNYTV